MLLIVILNWSSNCSEGYEYTEESNGDGRLLKFRFEQRDFIIEIPKQVYRSDGWEWMVLSQVLKENG